MGFTPNLNNVGGAVAEPIAGIATEILLCPIGDFTVVGAPASTIDGYTDIADLVTIQAAHTHPSGKGFTSIKAVLETGALTTTPIGERGGRLYQNQLVFETRGSDVERLAFDRLIKNFEGVILFREVGSGNLRQLGSLLSTAYPSDFSGVTEGPLEGKNSGTYTFIDKQKYPAPIYPDTFDVTMKA
nr:hypothetical protein [uncultured Flavobacterium sp.]